MTRRLGQGFTLTELLIAVAIISILAAVALPSYLSQVESGRETDGQALITRIMQHQERFYTENLRYTETFTELGYGAGVTEIKSDEGYYKVTAGECGATVDLETCVLITGTSETGGNTLTLDSLGNKTKAGNPGW